MKGKILIPLISAVLILGVFSGCVEEPENKTPVADFSYTPTIVYVDTPVTFSDESTDEDGTISTWSWDFGDDATSSDQNPTHTYTEIGTYEVTLMVTDDEGAEHTTTQDIEVTLQDIVATAINAGFTTLAAALTAADLVTTLQGEGPFTVFAPTDAAFAALNQTWLTNLLADTTNLSKVLTYHVISGTVLAADITDGLQAMTLEGTNLTFNVTGENVTINGLAAVTQTDIECSNGYIHVIDTVLLPESVPGPE